MYRSTCRPTVDRVATDMSTECRSSVNRVSIEVSIAGIDRHSIAGVFSTHEQNSANYKHFDICSVNVTTNVT